MITQKETRFTFTEEQLMGFDGDPGGCTACGDEADRCEPDARNYKCESCGELAVFGAQELLMMGLADIEE